MSERVLALIDGNSFYCSCERVFDGRLAKRPVIVLSNNDGCAIARTAEAKALGIGMGAPYFMIRDLCRREGVAVFSSNYALYGDMSARMNEMYRSFSPDVEIYSIDESFLDLTGFTRRDLVAYAPRPSGDGTAVDRHSDLRRDRPHEDPCQAREPHREEHPGAARRLRPDRSGCLRPLASPGAGRSDMGRRAGSCRSALLPMVARPSPTFATLIRVRRASP